MIYEFSDLTLDLDRRELTRGGQPIKLTKLSFKVLQALVQTAPALISHDDLIDQVWTQAGNYARQPFPKNKDAEAEPW